MEQEYFICSVASYEGHRTAPQKSMNALELCKKENAYFIEKTILHKGPISTVGPGCIILLNYNQYIVAYGKVTSPAYRDVNITEMDSPHRIDVEKWNWMDENNPVNGVDTKKNLLDHIIGAQNDKIKKLKKNYAINIINLIKKSTNTKKGVTKNRIKEYRIEDIGGNFIGDDDYINRVNDANPDDKETPVEDKCVAINGIYRIQKDAAVGKRVLEASKYECACCKSNKTFTTRKGVQYMEAHHLIPCNPPIYKDFLNKGTDIDREENIICLCPTCHRRIHYGSDNDRKPIIKSLYERQKEKLSMAGLDIELKDLLKMYDIK